MTSILADGISFQAASGGTGTFLFTAPRPSFATLAQAVTAGELTNGQVVSYLAQDSLGSPTQREWGHGTFLSAGQGSIVRTTVLGGVNNGIFVGPGVAVNFSEAPVVSLTALSEDFFGNAVGQAPITGQTLTGVRPCLTANLHCFISTTGNDVTGDGTQAKPWASSTPFFNLLYGTGIFPGIDGNGFDLFLNYADGVYQYAGAAAFISFIQDWVGGSPLHINGNLSNQDAVIWRSDGTASGSSTGFGNVCPHVAPININNIRFESWHAPIYAAGVGDIFVNNCTYNNCTNHIESRHPGQKVYVTGVQKCLGTMVSHLYCTERGEILYEPDTLDLTTHPFWSQSFCRMESNGYIIYIPPTILGLGGGYTGGGPAWNLDTGSILEIDGNLTDIPALTPGVGYQAPSTTIAYANPGGGFSSIGANGQVWLTAFNEQHARVMLSAPAALASSASYPLVFPIAQGTISQGLMNDGSGNLSWVSAGATFTPANANLTWYVSILSGTIAGGSGYSTPGTYSNVTLTGGHGSGAVADIVVAGGIVTAVKPSSQGAGGYIIGDVLTTAAANIGGGGSGFTFTLTGIGNDSNSGTAANAPLKTLQVAANKALPYDWQLTYFPSINVADGIYVIGANSLILPGLFGLKMPPGPINPGLFTGNSTTPGNCIIKTSGGAPDAIMLSGDNLIGATSGCAWQVYGFRIQTSNGVCVVATGNNLAILTADNLEFAGTPEACIAAWGLGGNYLGGVDVLTMNILATNLGALLQTKGGFIDVGGITWTFSSSPVTMTLATFQIAGIDGELNFYNNNAFVHGGSVSGPRFFMAAGCTYGSSIPILPANVPGTTMGTKDPSAIIVVFTQYVVSAPSSGGTVTTAVGQGSAILNPAGTLATLTVNFPATPFDKAVFSLSTSKAITALTMATTDGSTIVGAPTTLAIGGAAKFLYQASNTTWYIYGGSLLEH